MSIIKKDIIFCSQKSVIACDGICNKAWGINNRPKTQLSEDENDYIYLKDSELGNAPDDPGTYEGGFGKPFNKEMNKWCARECERSTLLRRSEKIVLPTFEGDLSGNKR